MTKISKIKVNLGNRSYPIYIGNDLFSFFEKLVEGFLKYSKVIIVSDNNVKKSINDFFFLLKKNHKNTVTFCLPPGEKLKSFKYLELLCEKILEKKIDRKTLLVCVGGGVIGDLVGLTASILLRGIDFVQVPTTLLSQVDSSVGGKTAINSKLGKNLIGSFYQPKAVLISLNTLKSLSYRQIISGYAEILKYSLIKDNTFFFWLKKNGHKIISLDNTCLIYAIKKSCQIKSEIVSEDEKEKGIREILNLGHTFGHAIESQTGFSQKILHGEAIFLGMFLAIKFSVFLSFGNKKMIENYENHMKHLKVPFRLSDYNLKFSHKEFIKHLRFDKKVKNNKLKFILLKQYGKTLSYTLNNEKLLIKFLETNLE
jgi:3-dehydroquinate synthase